MSIPQTIEQSAPAVIPLLFEAVAGDKGVPLRRLLNIRDILFSDFDAGWIRENQKFDFSFSSRQNRGFRFSYNDFGEKEEFHQKLLRCARETGGISLVREWEAVLEASRSAGISHQTTFGLEWIPEDSRPKLKLYFEELHHCYSAQARWLLAKSIARAARISCADGNPESAAPAAICLDFCPDGIREMKCYAISSDPKAILPAVRRWGAQPLRRLLEFQASLRSEKRAFYYLTHRRDSQGRLLSIKWYKIYEVRQISDFGPALGEIDAVWRNARSCGLGRDKFLSHCRRFQLQPFPVIASLDLRPEGAWKVDIYYSARDRQCGLSERSSLQGC